MAERTEQHPGTDEGAIDDSIGYGEAVAELEEILAELESTEIDVDRLADRVRRAAGLIELCRNRIGDARLQIDTVVAQLEAGAQQETT